MSSAILEVRNLTKEFRGFTALDDVNLRVKAAHMGSAAVEEASA